VIETIIFSMDRAMQCESLLRSMDDMCTGINHITVICRATGQLHEDAYTRLMSEERKVSTTFIQEGRGFGLAAALEDTVRTAPDGSYVCINVDDQIYYRPADFRYAVSVLVERYAFVWSWRLGDPDWHHPNPHRGGYWLRENSPGRDHGYLWHSDGALYCREDYLRVLDGAAAAAEAGLEWKKQSLTPNHLETIGVTHPHLWRNRRHVGPSKPCCMTWQVNKESTTAGRFGAPWKTVPETELDVLAQAFLNGKRVQNDLLYKDHSWTQRFQQPDGIPTHVRACEEASKFYASLIR